MLIERQLGCFREEISMAPTKTTDVTTGSRQENVDTMDSDDFVVQENRVDNCNDADGGEVSSGNTPQTNGGILSRLRNSRKKTRQRLADEHRKDVSLEQ